MNLPAGGAGPLDRLVPVLQTERLRLRAHRVSDYRAFAAMWADPAVYHYLSGKPSTPEESWLRLLRYPGLWCLLGYGFWAIEETTSGRCIGDIGYADFKRGIAGLDGLPELGWVLAAEAHGKGYASEALAAVLAWGAVHFGSHRSACIIAPDNAASIRVATRAGFALVREMTYRNEPILLFNR